MKLQKLTFTYCHIYSEHVYICTSPYSLFFLPLKLYGLSKVWFVWIFLLSLHVCVNNVNCKLKKKLKKKQKKKHGRLIHNSDIKILSVNCQGLNDDKKKRFPILQQTKQKHSLFERYSFYRGNWKQYQKIMGLWSCV